MLFQADGGIRCCGCDLDQGIKILCVKGERNAAIPSVISALVQNQRAPGGFIDLIQHGADTVEHGLQRIGGVGAPLLVLPKQTDQLILRDGTIAAVNHIGQQEPDFPGTVVTVI